MTLGGGWGLKTQVIIKVIRPPKTNVKESALNFDLFGVKFRVESDLGLQDPPPTVQVISLTKTCLINILMSEFDKTTKTEQFLC